MIDLPTITSGDDWLDVREGEEALVIGRLSSVSDRSVVPGFVIDLADWASIVVETEHAGPLKSWQGLKVRIAVTRTEDGLTASEEQIKAATVIRIGR